MDTFNLYVVDPTKKAVAVDVRCILDFIIARDNVKPGETIHVKFSFDARRLSNGIFKRQWPCSCGQERSRHWLLSFTSVRTRTS